MKLSFDILSGYGSFTCKVTKSYGSSSYAGVYTLIGYSALNTVNPMALLIGQRKKSLVVSINDVKPFLRPMSSLTEEFINNSLSSIHLNAASLMEITYSAGVGHYKYYQALYLFENKFDLYGLIPKGLALPLID